MELPQAGLMGELLQPVIPCFSVQQALDAKTVEWARVASLDMWTVAEK